MLLFFVQISWQQKDPLNDFCRRFGHQSAVIDDKLYIDGGLVDWNPIAQNPGNYSSKNPFYVAPRLIDRIIMYCTFAPLVWTWRGVEENLVPS